MRYSVCSRPAAPSVNTEAIANLWNASTTKSLYLVRFEISMPGTANIDLEFIRSTSAGVGGVTVTPDIDNDLDRALAPVSAALLRHADFGTTPTTAGPALARWAGSSAGSTIEVRFRIPIAIPQQTGIVVGYPAIGTVNLSEITYEWDE